MEISTNIAISNDMYPHRLKETATAPMYFRCPRRNVQMSTKTTKGCVKKPVLLYFLNNFLIFKYFFTRIHMDMPYYIWKQHVKFESIIIIKAEEILVLMEGTWYLRLPA